MSSSLPAPISLTTLEARRFHRRLVLLDAPVPDVATAMEHHGFVQIDPINVCGRIQDLILRNRVVGYREGDLFRHLHGSSEAGPLPAESRVAIEQHLPHTHILTALPATAWPYLKATMQQRSEGEGMWSGKLDEREEMLARKILQEIEAKGALSSEAIEDDQKAHYGWGSKATLAKAVLQKLFFHGRVLIGGRDGIRRLYDLPERVLPAKILKAPQPDETETKRWNVLLKLRQRRMVTLSRMELPHVADLVQPIRVAEGPMLYCLRGDLTQLEETLRTPDAGLTTLLAPLDPLIYDRKVTRQLWDYDYTWEVYTPPDKRVRGYYALPFLSGLELAGHVDPKADRKAGKLVVVGRSIRRGHRAADAVKGLAKFLGLK